jgi:DNA-binding HxlR family transcriptional regulator
MTHEPPVNVCSRNCPSQSVLSLIADRWSVLILYVLKRDGTRRYSDLQHALEGISQKMLTQTLRALERDGLVRRTSYPVVPPHTEYSLTELARSLSEITELMSLWAMSNMRAVLEHRTRYEARQEAVKSAAPTPIG